jgi:hypothetical protein
MSAERIPLYAQTSYDWYNKFQENNKPYAVSSSVGINEYTFGRTTPDNKFIVASGLVMNKKPFGIEMVGGSKKKNLINSIMKNSKNSKNSKINKKQKGGNFNIKNFKTPEFGMPQGLGTQFAADTPLKNTLLKKEHFDITNFKTPEFGMPQGLGTQMAVNTPMPNVLLKQQKTTNDPLQTEFGVNPGVADNLASNSTGYNTSSNLQNKFLDYSMMNSNDKVKAYNYYSGGSKKNKNSKNSKKNQKGGNLLSLFPKTPEFGMNPGVGDQMASNTIAYNPLLKQQKSSGQPLNTIFGDNGGVADQIASNDMPGFDNNNFSSVNWNGGSKEKKIKKKVTKKEEPKKKVTKKVEPKKKVTKKEEPKKKVTKKEEPKKKVTKKEEPKKKVIKKDESKKKVIKKDESKKKMTKKEEPKKKEKLTIKKFFNKLFK